MLSRPIARIHLFAGETYVFETSVVAFPDWLERHNALRALGRLQVKNPRIEEDGGGWKMADKRKMAEVRFAET